MPVVKTDNEVTDLIRTVDRAFDDTERKNFETHWNELSSYLLPMQSGIFGTEHGTPGWSTSNHTARPPRTRSCCTNRRPPNAGNAHHPRQGT